MNSLKRFAKWAGAAIVAASLLVGLGFYGGHYQYPPKNFDPQTCMHTVFTPFEDGTTAYLAWLDERASKKYPLYVADFTFTHPRVVDKYIELHMDRGVDVHILLDKMEAASVKSEADLIQKLRDVGIEVVIGSSPKGGAIMHNKFTVTGPWVEDGSWNYTDVADNQANVLNFNTCPSFQRAALYTDAWNKLHVDMKQQEEDKANGVKHHYLKKKPKEPKDE